MLTFFYARKVLKPEKC